MRNVFCVAFNILSETFDFSQSTFAKQVMSSTRSVRWLGCLCMCSKYDSFAKHWSCCTLVQCMHALPACCPRRSGQRTHEKVTDFLPGDWFTNPLLGVLSLLFRRGELMVSCELSCDSAVFSTVFSLEDTH